MEGKGTEGKKRDGVEGKKKRKGREGGRDGKGGERWGRKRKGRIG